MSKSIKISLILGSIFVCMGLLVVVIVGFTSGWRFKDVEWESRSYESAVDDEISIIDIDFSAGTLDVDFYDGKVVKVEYPHSERLSTECKVNGNTLQIQSVVRWNVQFWGFNKIPTAKVYIPYDMGVALKMCVNAGTVTVQPGTLNSVDLKMNAGTLSMDNVDCGKFTVEINAGTMNLSKIECDVFSAEMNAGTLKATRLKCSNIKVALSAGTAKIGVEGKKSDYSIWTQVSAGSCNVQSQNGATLDHNLSVVVSAGTVKINFDN